VGGEADQGDWGWADCIQALIERGHTLADVRGYTLQQVRLFTQAALRARRRELAEDLFNARVAGMYDESGFTTYLGKLTRG
jgi:hypothetical protein